MLDGIVVPLFQLAYNFVELLANVFWAIDRAILTVSYFIQIITAWIGENVMVPVLSSLGSQTGNLLVPIFTLAMIILAVTYLLGVFGVVRIVEFKSAVMWCAFAILLFQFGPELYQGVETLRRGFAGLFFEAGYSEVSNAALTGLDQIGDPSNFSNQLMAFDVKTPSNQFGAIIPTDTSIDGNDIAMAFLHASACDVLMSSSCFILDGLSLPVEWYNAGRPFDLSVSAEHFGGMNNSERQDSLERAAAGVWLALASILIAIFALLEQVINFVLSLALGIAFASMLIGVLFAFFKRTERIAFIVFDVILGLFIQSVITSLILSIILGFVILGASTNNGILLIGTGIIGMILNVMLLVSAAKALLGSVNGLMGAFSVATGGNISGNLTGALTAAATGGATLASGGTIAQAAGAVLGPGATQKAHYAAQAFGADTFMGQIANQIGEGAAASYAGPIGGFALGRSSTHASNVLGTGVQLDEEDRIDPITQKPYRWHMQDNGLRGVRTYADGSTLDTDEEDVPLERSRRKQESRAQDIPVLGSRIDVADGNTPVEDMPDNIVMDSVFSNPSGPEDYPQTYSYDPVPYGVPPDEFLGGGMDQPPMSDVPIVAAESQLPSGMPDESRYAGVTEDGLRIRPDLSEQERWLAEIEFDHPGTTGRRDQLLEPAPQAPLLPDEPTTSSVQAIDDNTTLSDRAIGKIDSQDDDDFARLGTQIAAAIMTGLQQHQQNPSAQSPAAPIPVPSEVKQVSAEMNPIQAQIGQQETSVLPGIGAATQQKLSSAGIHTVADLAHANPSDVAQIPRISAGQAAYYVRTAQTALGTAPNIGASAIAEGDSASRIAAEIDMSSTDNDARLAINLGASVSTAMSQLNLQSSTAGSTQGYIPTPAHADQIVRASGLPAIPESREFVRVAAAMQLSPRQATSVIQQVATTGSIGDEVGQSIRSAITGVSLPGGGQLDTTGITRAMNGLERVAQSMVTASQAAASASPDRSGASTATETTTAVPMTTNPNTD